MGKRIWNDGKQTQTMSTAALRYSNMQLNSGDKSEQGENMSKRK
jgi:hypothetical protein